MVGCFIGVTWILIILTALLPTGYTLKCYNCENSQNPACGVYFKPYQFKASRCGGRDFKCALQRQPADEEGGWVGISRVCYQLGTLPGMNETDGCKYWTNANGYTALFCFCTTNYCNAGSRTGAVPVFCFIIPFVLLLKSLIYTML